MMQNIEQDTYVTQDCNDCTSVVAGVDRGSGSRCPGHPPVPQTEAGRPPGRVLRGSAPLQLAAQPRLPRPPSRAEVLPDQSGVRLDYPRAHPHGDTLVR
ncbi:unnamed protein product [Boreogadus saida]